MSLRPVIGHYRNARWVELPAEVGRVPVYIASCSKPDVVHSRPLKNTLETRNAIISAVVNLCFYGLLYLQTISCVRTIYVPDTFL
jgi:hypothetical protein